MSAVIGALRAELSASIAQFQSDLGKAAVSLKGFAKEAEAIASEITAVGTKMAIAITGPLLLLAKASLDQAVELKQAMAQVETAIQSTGGVAGKNAAQLEEMAHQLENISTFDKSDILKGVTSHLLQFRNVTGDVFEQAQKLIVDFAARTGTDLESATLKWGRALNDPIGGVKALTRAGVQFTTQQQAQLKSLVQNGQGQKAQQLIIKQGIELYGGAAQALRDATPTAALNQSWRDLKETIGNELLPLLKPLIDDLQHLIEQFLQLSPAMQQSIIKWAAIAAVAGPVLLVFGEVLKTIGEVSKLFSTLGELVAGIDFAPIIEGLAALLDPFVAIAVAIGALILSVPAWRDQILGAFSAIWDMAKSSFGDAWQQLMAAVGDSITQLGAAFKEAWDGPIGDFFRFVGGALVEFVTEVVSTFGGVIIDAISGFIIFLARSVDFITDSLKLVVHFLSGDFSKAWQDAANVAADSMATIDHAARVHTPPPPKPPPRVTNTYTLAPYVPPTGGGGGGGGGFDLHNADTLKKVAEATKEFETTITAMDQRIQHGLDDLALPKSVATANALYAQIDDFVKKAKDAGVNTGKWATQIAALRARISTLQIAGLVKEAQKFGEEVNADALAVDKYGKGGLDPLTERLQAVDDQYRQLRDKIQNDIDANAALADRNKDAADAMEVLKKKLADLEKAHKTATAAAYAQVAAEQALAHLQSLGEQLSTRQDIETFKQSLGQGSPISSAQEQQQQIARDLAKQQSDGEIKLAELIKQRQEIETSGTQQQKDDLDAQIKLQEELNGLVKNTTAAQLDGQKKINDAFRNFTDSLSSDLSDMVTTGKFDFRTLLGDFEKLGENLFVKPLMDQLTNVLGSFLKSLLSSFAGGFAGGGWMPPGSWGVVGEQGPELAFAGAHGMYVQSNKDSGGAGGVIVNQYIQTPDYGAFRATRRQLARQAKQAMGS